MTGMGFASSEAKSALYNIYIFFYLGGQLNLPNSRRSAPEVVPEDYPVS